MLLYDYKKGDGTRGGSGKCNCDTGYDSELCNKCKIGYFEEMKNETYIKCTGNQTLGDLIGWFFFRY